MFAKDSGIALLAALEETFGCCLSVRSDERCGQPTVGGTAYGRANSTLQE